MARRRGIGSGREVDLTREVGKARESQRQRLSVPQVRGAVAHHGNLLRRCGGKPGSPRTWGTNATWRSGWLKRIAYVFGICAFTAFLVRDDGNPLGAWLFVTGFALFFYAIYVATGSGKGRFIDEGEAAGATCSRCGRNTTLHRVRVTSRFHTVNLIPVWRSRDLHLLACPICGAVRR